MVCPSNSVGRIFKLLLPVRHRAGGWCRCGMMPDAGSGAKTLEPVERLVVMPECWSRTSPVANGAPGWRPGPRAPAHARGPPPRDATPTSATPLPHASAKATANGACAHGPDHRPAAACVAFVGGCADATGRAVRVCDRRTHSRLPWPRHAAAVLMRRGVRASVAARERGAESAHPDRPQRAARRRIHGETDWCRCCAYSAPVKAWWSRDFFNSSKAASLRS